MPEVEITVIRAGSVEDGVVELWAGDRVFGSARLKDMELILSIEPRTDEPILVQARDLCLALDRAMLALATD
jgi:hypothetical protein